MRAHTTAAMLVLGLTAAAASGRERPVLRTGPGNTAQAAGTELASAGPVGTARVASSRGDLKTPRWGGRVQGRWWAGSRAPGGWGAYQRPLRGTMLPSYWAAPQWRVDDWSGFDLPPPPNGFAWSRYYDDAVLVDGRGAVHDTIGGVDWDQFDAEGVDYAYREDWDGDGGRAYVSAPPGAPYAVPGRDRAAVDTARAGEPGASTTMVARGAPEASGTSRQVVTASSSARDDRRAAPMAPGAGYPPAPPRGAPYPPAVATRAAAPAPVLAPSRSVAAPAPVVTRANGVTVITTSSAGAPGGYYSNGYYYPAPPIITVTVNGQPVVTAPPSETWDDEVTYTPESGGRGRTTTVRSATR
ncbi:RcnB family protein [Sphingomonas mucosissima]|uniref:Uncharacterized protein n=1 Tax=Sphingomonas mucosissima TaxID=370959 RepID=A0A245ZG49_9SPHN|nr:RcnB family protein [Sphingomonas mucosissima]OWK28698.1 hypothetical protein SPMU_29610 [Sphingomonas mucosissima]